ncbi:tetratricopeptide repeat protein [uncultured Flavobacterium sp.]|uniref:tetratricopeptide repeat protein n=1 Tax=uncultured Flavobacterium sp. TaxID=165435 RepID=UPI0025DAF3ED|nr:tetratricopeptide repeat protein [uncultured Flavobacterium sp.]
MKNVAYLLLFLAQALFAQPLFEKGNELFRQGQYEQAAATYETIIKNGQESAELYFNLGNTYFKQEKVAPAIFNYEKSLLLDPGNNDIEINLGYARQLITDNIEAVAQPGLAGFVNGLSGMYHYDTWAWIAVAFAFVCLGLFAGYYITKKTALKRVLFTGVIMAVIIVLASLIAGFYAKSTAGNEHPAIVFARMVQVKTQPSAQGDDAFIVHAGVKVHILETKEQWQKVQLPDESVGWVPSESIRPLIP